MVHEITQVGGNPVRVARDRFPDAAIIRPINAGQALAFDSLADAYWHATTRVDPEIKQPIKS